MPSPPNRPSVVMHSSVMRRIVHVSLLALWHSVCPPRCCGIRKSSECINIGNDVLRKKVYYLPIEILDTAL
ncbi:hypothetical protein M405DRAFT_196749 [Rhizopogon salebrosus TDB-379]|nr:hypothetical protein M405DRAFT_196749 [Rhizopogon salebrosus TDB-379]